MESFSAPKNTGKGRAHPEQGPREINFRYLKGVKLPSMASAKEALNARQANEESKAFRRERDIRVATYSVKAKATGDGA